MFNEKPHPGGGCGWVQVCACGVRLVAFFFLFARAFGEFFFGDESVAVFVEFGEEAFGFGAVFGAFGEFFFGEFAVVVGVFFGEDFFEVRALFWAFFLTFFGTETEGNTEGEGAEDADGFHV